MADDFMVMPLSCSSSRLSRYLTFPASLDEMIPFEAIRLSDKVVFPAKSTNEGKGEDHKRIRILPPVS